jgi:DNA-binding CsgD family transcriptional regulator
MALAHAEMTSMAAWLHAAAAATVAVARDAIGAPHELAAADLGVRFTLAGAAPAAWMSTSITGLPIMIDDAGTRTTRIKRPMFGARGGMDTDSETPLHVTLGIDSEGAQGSMAWGHAGSAEPLVPAHCWQDTRAAGGDGALSLTVRMWACAEAAEALSVSETQFVLLHEVAACISGDVVAPLLAHRHGLLSSLNPPQRETAVLLVLGLTEQQIAEYLHRSRHTVHDQIRLIYRAWQVGNSRAALRLWETPRPFTPGRS